MSFVKQILSLNLLTTIFYLPVWGEDCFGKSPYLDPNKESIKIQYHEWYSSEAIAHVFRILIEEKLGVPAEVVYQGYDDDDFVQALFDGTHHLNAQSYLEGDSDLFDSFSKGFTDGTVFHGGLLGYSEQEGLYIPDYLDQYDSRLNSYQGYGFKEVIRAFDTTKKATFDVDEPSVLEQIRLIQQELHAAQIANDLTAYNQATTKFDEHMAFNANFSVNVEDVPWGSNLEYVMKNLNLDIKISPSEHEDYETFANELIQDKYASREPFMLFFASPHEFETSETIKLRRVSFPVIGSTCLNAEDEDYNCDQPSVPLVKVFTPGLKKISPAAEKFIRLFRFNGDEDIGALLDSIINRGLTTEAAACSFLQQNEARFNLIIPPLDVTKMVDISSTAAIIFTTIYAICVVTIFIMVFGLIFFRNYSVVKAGSPLFMSFIAFGCLLQLTQLIFGLVGSSVASCNLQTWLQHLGAYITIGAISTKLWRLDSLFNSKAKWSMHYLRDQYIVPIFLGVVGVIIIVMILLTIFFPARVEHEIKSQSTITEGATRLYVTEIYEVCGYDDFIPYLVLALTQLLLLVFCVFFAFRTRKIPNGLNESKYIAFGVYTYCVCFVPIHIIYYFATLDPTIRFVILSLLLLFGNLVVLGVALGPKLFCAIMINAGLYDTKKIENLKVDLQYEGENQTQLEAILNDPNTSSLFASYCKEMHAEENLDFLIQSKEFIMLTCTSTVPLSTLQIGIQSLSAQYLVSGAPSELNLTGKTRNKFLSNMNKIEELEREQLKFMVSAIQNEVKVIVRNNLLDGFMKSKAMKKIIKDRENEMRVKQALATSGLILSMDNTTSRKDSTIRDSINSSIDEMIDIEAE